MEVESGCTIRLMSQKDTCDSEAAKADVLRLAVVQCAGFRCLAYMGSDGKWRNSGGEVLEVIKVESDLP